MAAAWVLEEMKTADLRDKRLDNRLREVLSQLAEHPTASIPGACGGHAEMTAAYRLFDNEKATLEGILAPHAEATRRRIAQQSVVLLVQDTTELDLTRPEKQVAGAGPLDGSDRRGVFVHPLHAFTPDGTPLGTLCVKAWSRTEKVPCSLQSGTKRAAIPIVEKESYRWVQTLSKAGKEARSFPSTQIVCVADSEADIYELLVEGTQGSPQARWIVRACYDRALQEAGTRLREQVMAQPVLFAHEVNVRGRKAKVNCETRGRRQARQSRQATVEARATSVTLRPPWRAKGRLPEVQANVVIVSEVNPPDGDEPVEWVLLTNLPVESVEQVRAVIQYYSVRWMIEVLFRVLKGGCRMEERRFEQVDRVLVCLGVYLIASWRTLYTCRLGRSCPEVSCEALFEPAEWKSVWKVVRATDPPKRPPRLGEVVRLVAQLGGYVNRKGAQDPGPQTIWIGIQRMHDLATCWNLFGPDARNAGQLV